MDLPSIQPIGCLPHIEGDDKDLRFDRRTACARDKRRRALSRPTLPRKLNREWRVAGNARDYDGLDFGTGIADQRTVCEYSDRPAHAFENPSGTILLKKAALVLRQYAVYV
ncbi:MAG: hypothetical protein B7Y12_04715 [Rhizobiales bacterium 24-66-13]|jgi:hypothetical protein|nr:MAG: hypothetical protein B7Y61_01540 [Rhizobiales bacterium 35-66-30]OYZ82171.1 MAG: hypothetical protein B7Y12_04715 [Rhizobiales bacterium 24-66-13]